MLIQDWFVLPDGLVCRQQVPRADKCAPPAGAAQCADGRVNDGDRLVDARYESGCTSAKDASEGSPLTCTLGAGVAGGLDQVKGSCSGTFAKIELAAPQGVTVRQEADAGRDPGRGVPLLEPAPPRMPHGRRRCEPAPHGERPLQAREGVGVAAKGPNPGLRRSLAHVDFGAVTAGSHCRARFAPVGFTPGTVGASGGTVQVACAGIDVKTASVSAGSGGQKIASHSSRGSCETAALAGRSLRCYFSGPNKGRVVGFDYRTDTPFASTTLHVLAGGIGPGGTMIVLRQTFFFTREGITCSQTVPSASARATL